MTPPAWEGLRLVVTFGLAAAIVTMGSLVLQLGLAIYRDGKERRDSQRRARRYVA